MAKKLTLKDRVIAGALVAASAVGFAKGAIASQDMDEIADINEKLNGGDKSSMVLDDTNHQNFDDKLADLEAGFKAAPTDTPDLDDDAPEADFFEAAKVQADGITSDLSDYRDARIAEIQDKTDDAVMHLTGAHGVESGTFVEVNGEGDPYQPGDEEKSIQYNTDGLSPDISEKQAWLDAHLASIDLATEADLEALGVEGQSLEEFKADLKNQLQEAHALEELDDHLHGVSADQESEIELETEPFQGNHDPVITDQRAHIADQFEDLNAEETKDKLQNALDTSERLKDAILNGLNDPNLSAADRAEMTKDAFGSKDGTGLYSDVDFAVQEAEKHSQNLEKQVADPTLEHYNTYESSVTMEAPEAFKAESSIGTEYDPDADPLPDRDDDGGFDR